MTFWRWIGDWVTGRGRAILWREQANVLFWKRQMDAELYRRIAVLEAEASIWNYGEPPTWPLIDTGDALSVLERLEHELDVLRHRRVTDATGGDR